MVPVEQYDYDLPKELIAQGPLPQRDQSRLMLVRRQERSIEHHRFCELPDWLQPGDCLVLNDTRVVPAKLLGRRAVTGGKWEGLFLREDGEGCWHLMCQTRGRLQPGERIAVEPPTGEREALASKAESRERKTASARVSTFHPRLSTLRSPLSAFHSGLSALLPSPELGDAVLKLELLEKSGDGVWTARPLSQAPTWELLERFGRVPLPHYIDRLQERPADREQYQTVYARQPGAVAAPTAGLHFTPELLERIEQRGIAVTSVTLHVGLGTFQPISAMHIEEHRLHREWGCLSAEAAAMILESRRRGGKVVAVGTTTLRLLETAAKSGPWGAWSGWTDLYIYPPYRFQVVDALLTNFHLPRTTLLVLVNAFADRELIRTAYQEAIHRRYRFYSYGDAMLIL